MSPALGVKIAAARTVGALVRRAGRGGGTSLPGKVLMRLEPGAIGELAARLPQGSVAISATNGKTTTAAMVASILGQAGIAPVHNRAGANMAGGIASTLLGAARRRGGIAGELGLFEIDEFWLGGLIADLHPRAVLLGNLFRDQLDRYGELETIADRWAAAVAAQPETTRLVLNADDPLIADLGRERGGVRHFGVEDRSLALPELQHAADSKHCRRCGAPYVYDAIFLGHLGHYHCENCGRERPVPDVRAGEIILHGTRGAAFTLSAPEGEARVELPLPGLYNVYNALGAAALALELGIELAAVVAGLQATGPAFGRAESVAIGATEMTILLVKNPAGANEVLRTLALEGDTLQLLAVLNDGTADGRDISWVWDADFELLAGRVAAVTCAGTRAAELALRLKYAGLDPAALTVIPSLPRALEAARQRAEEDRAPLFALPTYTALLELRALLADQGHVGRFWEGS